MHQTPHRSRAGRRRAAFGVLVALATVVAACSGGGDPEPTTTTTTTTRPTTTTTTTQPDGPGIEGAAPLTGETVAGDFDPTRPVVAVKIGNTEPEARPQAGINQADVVYEIQVEGQVTRFLALFHSRDAEPVGPVRSARLSEIPLLEELNQPLFTWHGANDILGPQVRRSAIVRASIDDVSSIFYRDRERPGPYNSFADGTAQIRGLKGERGGAPPVLFWYRTSDEGLAASAEPAAKVSIRFGIPFGRGGGEAPVEYVWDENDERWLRFQAGTPHVDAAGEQVAVENLIVRFTEFVASGTVDQARTPVPTAQVVGEGDAWVFTGGHVVRGRWIKPDNPTPTRYVDAAGIDIRLAPGRTWITIPVGTAVEVG